MFRRAYRHIENTVVAIVQKFHHEPQRFPDILGTGFFVSEHGIICTNRHVLDLCLTLPCPEGYEGLPFEVAQWREVEVEGQVRWGWSTYEVTIHGDLTFAEGKPDYLDHAAPDVAFLLTQFRETPTARFTTEPVEIGETVAFAGYPMGLRPLLGFEGFHQSAPTLHSGLVAAINPSRLAPTPHGFIVHANTQRGASGSPVFRPDGSVIGMVYMVIPEYHATRHPDRLDEPIYYEVPTALTGCISGIFISQALEAAHEAAAEITNRPLFSDKLKARKFPSTVPPMGVYKPK